MNLSRIAIVLRDRGVSQSMDLAFRFLATRGRTQLSLALFLLVPAWLLCVGAHWLLDWPWFWVWALAVGLASFLQGVFTAAAGRLMFSDGVSSVEVLRTLKPRLSDYAVAWLLTRALMLLALPTFVLFPWASARGVFIAEAVLLEGGRPREAMRRAGRFSQQVGSHALPLGVALLGATLTFLVLGELLGQGILRDLFQLSWQSEALYPDGGSPFALLGLFASVPYVATARFLGYIDARTRQDGWDVQVKFMALAAELREGEAS